MTLAFMPGTVPAFFQLPLSAEGVLMFGTLLTLIVSVLPKGRVSAFIAAEITLLSALICLAFRLLLPTQALFDAALMHDTLSTLTGIVLTSSMMLGFFYAYVARKNQNFYILGMLSLLGMLVLVSATDGLYLYLGFTLTSLPFYALLSDQSHADRATLLYLFVALFAGAILLFGISFWYGGNGTLILNLYLPTADPVWMTSACAFIVIAFACKLGAAPFHFWVRSVYTEASNTTLALFTSLLKIAYVAALIRFELATRNRFEWVAVLSLLGVVSLVIGQFLALTETHVKRLLGAASITSAGFVLLALIPGKAFLASAWFYLFSYALMGMAVFAILQTLEGETAERAGFTLSRLKGLHVRDPWRAGMLLIVLFSFIGVPPTIGFFAKFAVIAALVKSRHVILALIALAATLLGAYYYWQILQAMYFTSPEANIPALPAISRPHRIILTVNVLLILAWGIFPNDLLQLFRMVN